MLRAALQLAAADLASAPVRRDRAAVNEATSEDARVWLSTQGVASGIEKIYGGCERLMARIAAVVDLAPVSHGDGWHAALLRRMANPFPGAVPRGA